ADGGRWASLVLRGTRLDVAPQLRLTAASTLPNAAVERVLIRAWVSEQGPQSYHASFRLTPASVRSLDIEFPVPPSLLNPRIEIDDKSASWQPLHDSASPLVDGDPARVARVYLGPEFLRDEKTVHVSYQMSPGQLGATAPVWSRALGPLQTMLYPPRLCGVLEKVPV